MRRTLLLGLVVLVFSVLQAQEFGSLKGKVTDEKGNPIAYAAVLVESTKLGTNTTENGEYIIINIPVGKYTITVLQMGYQTKKFENIQIKLGKETILNAELQKVAVELEEFKACEKLASPASFRGGRSNEVQYSMSSISVQGSGGDMAYQNWNTEDYGLINENKFLLSTDNPLSTFSIDVDAASYANCRRYFTKWNQLPPKDAVRIEEFINYFDYDYPNPKGKHPFSITTEYSETPWNKKHKLLHIGIQGKKIDENQAPPSNLVFLLDVSGSMDSPDKLQLVKKAFKMLVKQLREEDRVAIVVYAGAAGLVLESTPGHEKSKIIEAIDRLNAGGSTAGGAGIQLAYKVAEENLLKRGNNRVILATDGDFNIGTSSDAELVRMMEEKRNKGIFFTILGFGTGNYKDNKMEQIADNGNGNYFYCDNILEAKKVFVHELGGTLHTIAKDVKIQIEFDPTKVKAYRLIGYENRLLDKEDFNDDKKDAGELGAGHTVTALYEIIPAEISDDEFLPKVDDLKYQKTKISKNASKNNELATIKFRYKKPKEDTSILITKVIDSSSTPLNKSSENFKFSASVAEFGMILRDSEFKAEATIDNVLMLAKQSMGKDSFGYRSEFLRLVKISEELIESNSE